MMECALALVQLSRDAALIVCLALVTKLLTVVLNLSHFNQVISLTH